MKWWFRDFDRDEFVNVGGIAGTAQNATIERSYFKGTINTAVNRRTFVRVAGIVPIGINLNVTDCYMNADLTAKGFEMNTMIAGIVAWLDNTTIDKCYAAGTISGENLHSYCYAGGMNASANSESIFGIILTYGGTVKNSAVMLRSISANGTTNVTNNIGNFSSQSNNKEMSADAQEAKQQSTYESLGWDFTNIWMIDNSYPELR